MNLKKQLAWFPFALVLYEVAVYLSMDAYVPALPDIAKGYHVSIALAQLTAVVWMLGGLALQFFIGPMSDRYGRRPILLSGGIVYVIASLLCAIAPNIHLLLIARFLQGAAMPTMYIAGYAAVNELFETEQAVHILARMNRVTIIAPAFGPILGGAFLLIADWHWIFVILAVFSTVLVGLLYFVMPESAPLAQRSQPMQLRLILQQYGKVFKRVRFINSALVTLLPKVGLVGWIVAGPFVVTDVFQKGPVMFGFLQGIIFGAFIFGTKVVSRFARQARFTHFIHVGIGVMCFGAALSVAFSIWFPSQIVPFTSALVIVLFGTGLMMPILSRRTIEESDASMGVRVAVFSLIRISVGFLGSLVVTLFYRHDLLSIALVIATFIFITLVLWVMQETALRVGSQH